MNVQINKTREQDGQGAVTHRCFGNWFARDGSQQTPIDVDPPTNESARGQDVTF